MNKLPADAELFIEFIWSYGSVYNNNIKLKVNKVLTGTQSFNFDQVNDLLILPLYYPRVGVVYSFGSSS